MVSDLQVQFGKRLRELRMARGFSQEELAHRARLHVSYVGQIERGLRNPSLVNIGKLADAVDVAIVDLFNWSGRRKSAAG